MKKQKNSKNYLIKTILVVEDEVPLRDAIKIKLAKEKINSLFASSAEEGLEFLKKNKINLVWLDLLLPGMGGFAFLEQIRKEPKWRHLPVVIVSVSASPEKIRQAFEHNVLDYLVKSQYQLGDIIKRIKTFLK